MIDAEMCPGLSIVITTYNRADFLQKCIESTMFQKEILEPYEVVVIDNDSVDNTREIVESLKCQYDNLKYFHEKEPGTSCARNRGCREAKADWIAYIDDDDTVSENFVREVFATIKSYDFDCFGGCYKPVFDQKRPHWFSDRYAGNAHLASCISELPENQYLPGGSIVIRKEVLQNCGSFYTYFGPQGAVYGFGEDTNLIHRIRNAGYKIGFNPLAVIFHFIPSSRYHIAWFFKSAYQQGYGSWLVYERKVTVGYVLLNLAAIFIFPLVYLPINLYRLIVSRDYYVQNVLIDTFRRSFSAFGRAVAGIGHFHTINASISSIVCKR